MAGRRQAPRSPRQGDLLEWQSPEPTQRFADADVRASTIDGQLARAISTALLGHDRTEIARQMGEYLGRPMSRPMLDAYASVAREEHGISAARFVALLMVTADRRLLEMLAEKLGWAVIERRYLPLIQLAAVREREDELRREGDALRRQAKSGGLL